MYGTFFLIVSMKTKRIIFFILIFIVAQGKAADINRDTTISGSWDLHGKILNISAKISGNCIIKNALIEANPFMQLFDTTVSLSGCRAREFSAMWYGASPGNKDNSTALQKSINACINQCLYLFRGAPIITHIP